MSEIIQNLSKGRYLSLATVTIVVSLIVSLVAIEVVLRWTQPNGEDGGQLDAGLFEYHPNLGWVTTRDWRGGHTHRDYQVRYTTNGYGHRGTFIKTARQPGEKRYAYFGDSFTFGMGVEDNETFTEVLNGRGQGKSLHLNFGVPGYSTDQEVLYAEDRVKRFEPDTVILVVYLGNDLIDNLGPYPLQVDFAKPYFELEKDSLSLRNTPVPRQAKPAALRSRTFASVVLGGVAINDSLLGRSQILRRLGYRQTADDISGLLPERVEPSIELFDALIKRLTDFVQARNAKLLVALLPGQSFVREPDGYSAQYQDYIRGRILDRLRVQGISTLDLGNELRSRYNSGETDLYFPDDGHLTVNGHRVVADLLEKAMP